jgi:CheY-like chemotaxis protein
MGAVETFGKVFVVDTNLFFVKRLSEALRQQGFEAVQCSEPAYALTMIEWNMPVAILCATSFNNSIGFEIPSILRADPKTSHIPVVAIGDRGQQSQLEALRAGYADVVDRRLGAEEIAAHLMSLLSSHRDGFHPTQMLARSETALDGRLSLVDLPGVIQVLSQSRQTGGLHINADTADGIIFFDAGEIIHAESGQFAGDDAIIHLVKSCYLTKDGVYKFIPGDAAALRTVQGTLNALILDALRQLDEEERDTPAETTALADAVAGPKPQALQPETENEIPHVTGEPAMDLPSGAEAGFATGTENVPVTPTEIEAEAWPEIEAEPEVVTEIVAEEEFKAEAAIEPQPETEPETETGDIGQYEIEEYEDNPEAGNAHQPSPDPSVCESIIDEDTLRELNELLSGLKVEERESHE